MSPTARLLIVEDNRANLELMSYLLRAYGYDVVGATDGEAALERLAEEAFALIVCDVQLPGLDGFELVRLFKGMAALNDVPVVAVSALAMVGDRDRLLASGFDGYIAKPIEPENFVETHEGFLHASALSSDRPAAAALTEPHAFPARSGHKAFVLVVDDEPNNRFVLKSVLEPSGYRVDTVANGSEAMLYLRETRPDLILSDLHLGVEPDFEFLERVKADPALPAIPMVMLSSTTSSEVVRREGLSPGADRFLFRPMEPAVPLAEIEGCLQGD